MGCALESAIFCRQLKATLFVVGYSLLKSDFFQVAASESAFTQPVSRNDLLNGNAVELVLQKVDHAVSSRHCFQNSFGWSLMRKMGWTDGSGLGKHGNGPMLPVSSNTGASYSAYGKRGLGYRDEGIDQNLVIDRAEALFQCFVANAVMLDDLVFSSEFSPQEREIIHNAAEKYGLSHNSLGSGEQRHLVVRVKFTIDRLVEELRRVGGKAGRYELVEAHL